MQPTSKIRAAIIIMTTTHVGLDRYTFSAREVLHARIWKGLPSETGVARFLYFSSYFLSHCRSSEVRATVIVATAGVRLSPRNLAIRSSHHESAPPLTNSCHRRTPPRLLPVPANVLTLSAGSVRILADKIYTKKRRRGKKSDVVTQRVNARRYMYIREAT